MTITSKYLRLFVCPTCLRQEMRWREWTPVLDRRPYYKGEEYPLPVHCENGCGTMEQPLSGIGKDLLPESFLVDNETLGLGDGGQTRISSLRELRTIERESERRFRDRAGQIVNFRAFTQERGNSKTNSFEGSSYQTGRSTRPERRATVSNLPINVRPVRS